MQPKVVVMQDKIYLDGMRIGIGLHRSILLIQIRVLQWTSQVVELQLILFGIGISNTFGVSEMVPVAEVIPKSRELLLSPATIVEV